MLLRSCVEAFPKDGVEPSELTLHKPTLDDVFLALTGEGVRELPDAEDDEPDSDGAGGVDVAGAAVPTARRQL